ncbi:colicin immunity domain-containing protein [Bordetella petrii]|uniref:Colicin D immunity protein domain-containing protein n=1 Tax=Bordetella petrii (strain ATCC BAA-461 / DSM 12804 / CCUG 43448 / CIP 107267 / Se-1111R) TaxID=340100 RepID=A9I257_BORPD|nr:colicin immunity domain-containing protein [Bordetella petrii]CAP40934.1 conserved hypothetical protein [Bordetella petrii]
MSFVLLEFAKSFVEGRISAPVFSEAYMELWKIERDSGSLIRDESALSERLSSIFCAADMYNSDSESREEYEFDDEQLRFEVCKLVEGIISK